MPDGHEWGWRRWRVVLIAHDAKKPDLLAFIRRHRKPFGDWSLIGTEATGAALRQELCLNVRSVLPGPRGGNLQIGAEIASGEIDALIFLRDPLTAQPHEPDITALLRVADVHNTAVATNLASAGCLVRALAPEGTNVTRL
ncbi:MAG: methylglyoxal synthase [Candidatus Methylomirabilales bacterium]